MEMKLDRDFSREELADYLTALAGQIRQGELQVAGVVQKLPNQSAVEIFCKEKKGRLTLKLQVSFATLEHYPEPRREAVLSGLENFKVVKKKLGVSFGNLTKVAAQGRFPEAAALSEFLRDNEAFAQQTDPEWQEDMATYLDHVKNLENAFTIGNLEMFQHELADLKASLARCHKNYK